jgi:DNA polymerase-3 subunit epsilon
LKLAVDLETTGFHKYKNEVIEIGAVEILENKTLGRSFQAYLKPTRMQYYGGEEAHGISAKKALKFPSRRETLIKFLEFLVPIKDYFSLEFIQHADNNFDFDFLKNCFIEESLHDSFFTAFDYNKTFSTLDLARKKLDIKSKSLPDVCNYLDIRMERHHSALSDAMACAQIYCKLSDSNKQLSK